VDPNPFTAVDRDLLKRCLNRSPGSWNEFVDRFLSLIYHVIGYTAHLRSVRLNPEDVEDIAAEVLLKIVANDFRVLREFRGEASFATYLTVVSRRICIQELIRRQRAKESLARGELPSDAVDVDDAPAALKSMERLEEVEKLLRRLSAKEREIVRLYYLEGRTYEEISTETEVPVNTIGAVLSRARKRLRGAKKKSGGADSLAEAASGTHTPLPSSPPPPPSSSKLKPPPSSTKLTPPAGKPAKPAKPGKPARPSGEKKNED
jgi:RNA polymerase sigma-70 factor (ECF subfamily)